jgi:transcriptional antiterminator NusG
MTPETPPHAAEATPPAPAPAVDPVPVEPPPAEPSLAASTVAPEPPQPEAPVAVSEPASSEVAPVPEAPPVAAEEAPPVAAEVPAPEPEPQPVAAVAEPAAETPAETAPEEPVPAAEPPSNKRWYVVKVQSGREESIKEAIERRVKIERLEEFFGQIVIPTETHVEMRKGKRVTKKTKLYPGYLMAEVEYNDRILYLFRETSGVGDFVGGTITRPPPPMTPKEVQRMMGPKPDQPQDLPVKPAKPRFQNGDRVKVLDGAFKDMEGEVKEVLEDKGQVKIEVTIFGRPVTMDLEAWHVEPA